MSAPKNIVIFDVDGVLVDVRGSFHQSVIDTVFHFTGKRFPRAEVLKWKSQSGYNDDWKLSTAWIRSLGIPAEYEQVKAEFQKFYWGANGKGGNVRLEKWLLPRRTLARLAKRAELGVFTGRTRRELKFTFDRNRAWPYFRSVVTMDDLTRLKPEPEGLLRILNGRHPQAALYLGDNVDDALSAQRAGVPFLGVLPRGSLARRVLGRKLLAHGALGILHSAADVERWLR